MERILVVDDDPDIQCLVCYNLQHAGFATVTAGSGRIALDMVMREPPDLVILDLMLPDMDGMEVCRSLRGLDAPRRIPVLMLSARGEENDRILGFELGADDYVTKPFSPRELVLRVRSILRRGKEERAEPLRISEVEVFPLSRQCLVRAEAVDLTAKEFDLLVRLMTAGGDVVGRDALLEEIWGYSGDATSRTLDTHVRRLREKLGPESGLIETVRGIGFRIALPPRGEPE